MRSSLVSQSAAVAKAQKQAATLKTKLRNGLTVVAQDNNGPVSQLVLAFRAGSRYQSAGQNGLVHHVRNFVGRDVQSYPGLQLVWSSAASGGSLSSFSTRDVFGVQITVPRDHAAYALSILGHVAGQPAFKPWELEDVVPTIKADLAYKNAFNVVFEDIHRAAYRNGSLANSIFASRREVGAYKHDALLNFANKHLVSGNGVIVGVNVDAETLKNYADESGAIADGNAVNAADSPYKGGDFRRDGGSLKNAHIIIAGNGASAGNVKELASQAVLLAQIGRVSPLKFATLPGSTSSLGKLPAGVSGSAFQAIHQDAGLVGTYLVASPQNADAAVRSTVAGLRSPKIENIEALKRQAINEILFAAENNQLNAVETAISTLGNGPETSALVAEIGKVTAQNVEQFAKKAFSKLSIASYGNIGNVPYSDEL